MTPFTGFQYLLIDAANQFGLDKKLFEERIQWAMDHLNDLESFIDQADTKPLYIKAVMAIRKAQQGVPTGHLVGFDGVCSGIQVMSALTGCIAGATATGMVDPNVRADAYSAVTKGMEDILGGAVHVSRADAKQALMTVMYGSKKLPKVIFGEDTPELNAFYQSAQMTAPGAWELLQDLLGSWQPFALEHSWVLPDGFVAKVKVMAKKEARIEVDELDHATFTYEFYENVGSKTGISLPANVVHSWDAYVLRCIHRRCNYDRSMVEYAYDMLQGTLGNRSKGIPQATLQTMKMKYYVAQYERSGIADVVILPYIDQTTADELSTEHLQKLLELVEGMLKYLPFEVVTIHDEFKCHPNNMNHLRQQYINVMADIADSNVLDDILSQIHRSTGHFSKLSNNLGDLIRGSNYALS